MGTLGGIPLEAGDVLAKKYRLEHLIGEGGAGLVVRATHLQLDVPVAIKFLRTALATDELRLRFEREARAIENISSDHVVLVYDVGTLPDGEPYMVMEYLEGRDLSRVLKEDGKLPLEDAVDCMLQVCEALGEAHAAGIVHRDLKPANLFLTRTADGAPHIKVVDFGISKILDAKLLSLDKGPKEMTNAYTVLGSPRYMAPEQLRSSKDVDFRADLWSVGAVLFQLVTGRHPFEADNNVQASLRVLASPPELLRTFEPKAPPGLEAVVNRCLTKERTGRFQSAKELSDALRPFASPAARESIQRMRDARPSGNLEIAINVGSVIAQGDVLKPPSSSGPVVAPAPSSISVPVAPPSSRPRDLDVAGASVRRAYERSPSRALKIALTVGGLVAVLLCFALLTAAKHAARTAFGSTASAPPPEVVGAPAPPPPRPKDPIIVPLDAARASP